MALAAEVGFHGSVTFIDFHNSRDPDTDESLSTIMSLLCGKRVGNFDSDIISFKTERSPHLVLETLDREAGGYRVVAANTAMTDSYGYSWQIWTLYKEY